MFGQQILLEDYRTSTAR